MKNNRNQWKSKTSQHHDFDSVDFQNKSVNQLISLLLIVTDYWLYLIGTSRRNELTASCLRVQKHANKHTKWSVYLFKQVIFFQILQKNLKKN